MCCCPPFSLVSEIKTFFSELRVSLSVLTPRVCNFYSGIMLCDVWYDIIYPVGGDFGLFHAGNVVPILQN